MRRTALGLCLLVSLAANPRTSEEAFERGKNLLLRGAYAEALAQFDLAESNCDDPIALALQRGLALYHLALEKPEGRGAGLREAEALFRCCLEPDDPSYGPALFWLGNCQVQRSGTDGLAELQAAQDCFERCLVVSTLSPEMHSAAMQNLEVVHLRLAQLQPPSARDPENPPNHEEPKNNDRPNRDPKRQLGSEGAEPGREQGFTKSATPGGKTNADKEPRGTDQPPPPGAGKRQPPADRAELVPISPQEASEHLEQAAQRILGEEMQHRKSKARPPQQGVRDW